MQRTHRLPCNAPHTLGSYPLLSTRNPFFSTKSLQNRAFVQRSHISELVFVQCSHMSKVIRAVSPYILFLTCNVPIYQFWSFLLRAAYPHVIVQRSHIPKPRLCTGNVDNFWPLLCEHDHFMDYWSHFDCLFRFVLICQSLFCFVNRAEFPYIERFRTCFRATYPHIKSHNVQVPTSSPFNYQYLTGTTLREPLEQHGTYPSSWLTLARY